MQNLLWTESNDSRIVSVDSQFTCIIALIARSKDVNLGRQPFYAVSTGTCAAVNMLLKHANVIHVNPLLHGKTGVCNSRENSHEEF